MVKLNVKRKLGKSVIDIGIQEIEDMEFARQLVEKGLAEVVEGEIPERAKDRIKRTVNKVVNKAKIIKKGR